MDEPLLVLGGSESVGQWGEWARTSLSLDLTGTKTCSFLYLVSKFVAVVLIEHKLS